MPLNLPPIPRTERERLRQQRRRRQKAMACRPIFKILWGAAVTVSTICWWLVDNCNPPGRLGALFNALGTLNDPQPSEVAPAVPADPVGQSQETH
jgi:hypothetical protein